MDTVGIVLAEAGWDTVQVSNDGCRSDACLSSVQRSVTAMTTELRAEDEAVKLFVENFRLPRLRNYKVLSFVFIPFFFQVYNPTAASMV